MAVKPILYSAPMVRALIAGTKTQTRRALHIVGHKTFSKFGRSDTPGYDWHFRDAEARWHDLQDRELKGRLRYAVGDILWVRETCRAEELTDGTDGVRMIADGSFCPIQNTPKAANDWLDLVSYRGGNKTELVGQTVTSIHMPRWASRLTQVVTDVRVQRLQDITEEDARAEGVFVPEAQYAQQGPRAPVLAFANLWTRINGEGSWEANPLVVAYTVETHLANVDAFLASREAAE